MTKAAALAGGLGALILGAVFLVPHLSALFAEHVTYSASVAEATSAPAILTATTTDATSTPPVPPPFVVTHVATPDQVKAIYMTSWAAGTEKFRKEIFNLIDTTEVNAVVIDIKDYTGRISFPVDDPTLQATGAVERRIPDIKEFIGELHARGVYVIGRLSAFQDSYMINLHPEWAVKSKATGGIWGDYKNVHWIDAGATPFWDYLVAIGKESYNDGFDEINFDYIRFPSDGNMADTHYSWEENSGLSKPEVIKNFFEYVTNALRPTGVKLSADLFGLTTSAADDLGIGQVLDNALPYFDYVAPMVYPSHFADGFIGYAKPAEHPYQVIQYSMQHAETKALKIDVPISKLRPWLQAFDLGAIYTPDMVRDQIQAAYDNGLSSWMLWNAGVEYDPAALKPKGTVDIIGPAVTLPPPPVESTSTEATSTATTTGQN